MPNKKARAKELEPLVEILEDIVKPKVSKTKAKKDSPVPVGDLKKSKPKPKPKTKSKSKTSAPVKPAPLEIYELAALYEFFHRNTVTDSYRTWPDMTIAEATEIVKHISPAELSSVPSIATLYHNDPQSGEITEEERKKYKIVKFGYEDLREFRNALIEKEISIGVSIPLFIEHFKIEPNDPIMATLLYSWAAYVRTMIERNKKLNAANTRHAVTVQEGDFCVEIECNIEQAKWLERYCTAWHGTLLACRDYLKSLGNRAPKRIDKISSKLATQIRKEQNFDDVPRSLVVCALNGYTQKLKFDNNKDFKRDLDRFYVKDNFKLFENSLTVGKAKEIAITKIVGGERLDLTVRGISFARTSPLVYTVTIQYDKMELLEQQYGTD